MQQSTLLQSSALGTYVPSQESTAKSEASQRDHLKPSQCKVGDLLYRYHAHRVSAGVDEWDESLGSYIALYTSAFKVEHVTAKGCKILAHDSQGNWGLKPVLDHYVNKYAYPTKVEALLGFMARKKRQQVILNRQLADSREAERKAEQLLAKELK